MIKLKVLSKAYLLLACLLCFSAYNTANAQENCETTTTSSQDDGHYSQSTTTECSYSYESTERQWTFSPDNPFATSEYEDIAVIAEAWLQLGGNIDEYFYSEGFTTGTDGDIGNEYLCIRDDFNKVYFGRSDVCVNRQMSGYDYIHFDKVGPDEVDSLAQLRNSMLDPDQIYKTGDLLGNTSQYWTGCFSVNQGWGGTSGGSCPTINDEWDGQINFGYVNRTLTNTAAIDQALKGAGLETTGYTYIWKVKNLDANYKEQGNGRSTPDPFEVTVKIYDENGNSVYEKSYDYSYYMDWTRFMGTETFDEPFNLDEISELQLSVTGYDIGYWAGYYGPEFREPNINLLYRVAEPTGPSPEEILKEQMCTSDPTYDPSCPGYNDAMMAQIASTNTIDDINSGADIGAAINDGSTQAFDDTTGITNDIAEATGAIVDDSNDIANTTGAIVDDGSDSGSDNGMPDPVQEATGEPDPVQEAVAEAVAEATPDPVQEATEQTTEQITEEEAEATVAEATGEPKSAGPGLNATQLSALNAANNVANSAVSSSTAAAQASAGIGLTESGGVSSTLTSVDPTGSTSADGGINGGSNFEFGSSADDSSTSVADAAQSTGTSTTQSFSNTQQSGSAQSFGNTQQSGSAQSFGNTQQSGSAQSFSNNGSDNGQSQNSSTGSNNSSQSNGSFGTTDFASTGQTAQDSNPLADGGAVETTDITGEQDLATSNEALTQLAMLNDPTNPINQIINDITANMITQAVADAEETAEESAEESVESQNAQEDALVAEALAGSDDEDAQAALLGYNPNFRAYQQPQMPGGDIYSNQGVYEDQKTYDNPRAGLFNGASDALHREMVRSQYELGN